MTRRIFAVALGIAVAAGATLAVMVANEAKAQTLRTANLDAPPNRGDPTGPGLSYQHVITWDAMYDALTTIEPDGKPLGVLATSWENKSPTSWVFKLRPGVAFHTGTPFNADAMVAAVKYLQSDESKKYGSALYNTLAHIVEAAKIDDMTVELKTSSPAPIVPSEAAALRIVDPRAWADLGRDNFGNKPSGTGPFRVTTWDNTKVEMTRFDGGPRKAKVSGLLMYFMPEPPTRVQAINSDAVDIAFSIAADDVGIVTRAGGKVAASTSPSITILVFNQSLGGYTTDQRVRLAFNLAIDKSYTQTLLGGYSVATAQPAARTVHGHQADIAPYPYDPARAKQLHSAAGYGNGLKAIAEVVLTSSDTKNVLEKVAADVAKVGIDLDMRPITLADLSARSAGTKPYEGQMHISNYGSNPAMDMMRPINAFHSCRNMRKWTCFPEIQPDIDAANAEFDVAKRNALLRKIALYYHEQAPDIFLFEAFQLDAVRSRVQNFRNDNWRVNWADISVAR